MTLVEQKLAELIKKLETKSFFPRLVRSAKGEAKDKVEEAIAWSSLLTHSLIEARNRKDYKDVVANVYESVGKLIFELED